MVARGADAARAAGADSIVALGGGSSLDCAKGLELRPHERRRTCADYRGYGKAARPLLPMIGVPTTAGTGSEAQSYALISDAETHDKMACGDPKAAFRVAILDPELTVSQPRRGHRHRRLRRALARRRVLRDHDAQRRSRCRWRARPSGCSTAHFERVLRRARTTSSARGAMLLGAHLAGMAIEASMLGATHACANPLSARYGTAHGVAIALHAAARGAVERARGRAALRRAAARGGPRSGARSRAAPSPIASKRWPWTRGLPRRPARGRSGGDATCPRLAAHAARAVDGRLQPAAVRRRGRRSTCTGGRCEAAAWIAGAPWRVDAGGAWSRRAPRRDGRPPAGRRRRRRWPQFRGDARLTGVRRRRCRALKVAWTDEAGGAVESSAAIADGHGRTWAAQRAAARARPRDRRAALVLRHRARRSASPRPASRAASSTWATSRAWCTRCNARDGIGGLDLQDEGAGEGARRWWRRARCVVGSYDQHVYALDARTGARAWAFETDGQVHATAAVDAGVAYVTGCDGLLRALRVADGKETCSRSRPARYTGASPALAGGRAYYGTFENEVLGVDLAARKVLWRYRHPERHFPFYSSAAVAAGRVVLGGRDKLVHALDAATGKAAWTFTTRARVDSSPLVAGGQGLRRLQRRARSTCSTWPAARGWRSSTPAPPSRLARPGRRAALVIGTQDGQVIALGPKGS